MHCFPAWPLAACLLLAVAPAAPAKTLSFPEQKCQVDIPDDWMVAPKEGTLVLAVNPDHTKLFDLRVNSSASSAAWNRSQRAEFEAGISSQGFDVSSREAIRLHGVPFYRVEAGRTVDQGNLRTDAFAGVANNRIYCIDLIQLNGSPGKDAELQSLLGSFDFIGKPEFSIPAGTGDDGAEESIDYKIGFYCGLLALICIPLALAWSLIGMINRPPRPKSVQPRSTTAPVVSAPAAAASAAPPPAATTIPAPTPAAPVPPAAPIAPAPAPAVAPGPTQPAMPATAAPVPAPARMVADELPGFFIPPPTPPAPRPAIVPPKRPRKGDVSGKPASRSHRGGA
jgi:hypothetical protein